MSLRLEPADLAAVQAAPVLASLPPPVFDAVMTGATVKTMNRGELLFVQGDPVTSLFVVLEGWVKVYRLTPSGGEAVVAVFTRGQSFAEAAAFVGGRFPASGEAVTDGRILKLQSGNLLRLIRENPDVGLAMLATTSKHLHMLVQQIEQLKAHTGAQRVAEFLLSLCKAEAGGCRINLPYDKALIAGRLGMQPESLSRAFVRLRQIGVNIDQNTAHIDDVDKLRTYAEESRQPET
ncbi:MAG: Crp/Fnr family transcriptional regulator [Alphaproteobacteria bacterium]|nr:Crp/Fnr family transcriptional regulator [Alphaproteobacteria bacterium]